MFKKKANNKKVNLNQELQQIQVAPPQPQDIQVQDSYAQSAKKQESAQVYKIMSRQKMKANFISLQALQKVQIIQNKPVEKEFVQLKKEEMTDYLRQIRNFKPIQTTQEEIQQPNFFQNTLLIQQNNGYNSEEFDNNQMIEVEQDFQGGFSPMKDQQNQFEEDYQDQLIKRTLTKHNYQKLRLRGGPMLSDLKALQTKDKLLEKIEKVSSKKIENTIKRDLQNKKKKSQLIQQQLRMKKYICERQKNEIAKKQKRLEDLKKQLEKVNSIIYYLYYYGDKVTVFEKQAILKQIQKQNNPQMVYNFEDVE